jgi:hypothetical protein
MSFSRRLLCVAATLLANGIIAASALPSAGAAQLPGVSESARVIKDALTPETFTKIQATIKPQSGECRWEEIPWLTDLHEARVKAAAEGKPLFVWSASADALGCT